MFTSISHRLCLVPVLPVVCWRAHALFTLIVCVCVHSGVQHTLCCVLALFFFRFVYLKLSASLDCHFWIAIWYSLTFIYRGLTFFPNCIWTPTFSAKHTNLASVVWHSNLMLFHFNTVTTNFNGEGGKLSLYILEDRWLSFCPFTILLRAIVLAVLLRFTDCKYPLIYFSSYRCMIFFTCKQ